MDDFSSLRGWVYSNFLFHPNRKNRYYPTGLIRGNSPVTPIFIGGFLNREKKRGGFVYIYIYLYKVKEKGAGYRAAMRVEIAAPPSGHSRGNRRIRSGRW